MRRWILWAFILIGLAALWALRPPRATNLANIAGESIGTPPPTLHIAPTIEGVDPVLGMATAAHTIIEFGDFSCPACREVLPILTALREQYGDDLRIVWKDFPILDRLTGSRRIHIAGRCAQREGKFWDFFQAAFATQPRSTADLVAIADSLSIPSTSFRPCLDDPFAAQLVDVAAAEANRLGISGAPTFFVDGTRMTEYPSLPAFQDLLAADPAL